MKTWTKLAPWLLAVGLLMMLIGYGMAGFSLENLNTESFEPAFTEVPDAVTAITVRTVNNDITITPYDGSTVQIRYFESDKETFDIAVDEGGVLTMARRSNKPWFEYIGVNFLIEDHPIEISVPRGAAIALDLKTVSGSITANDMVATGLTMKTTNGHLTSIGTSAQRIEAGTTSGGITLSRVSVATRIDASVVNGEVALADVTCEELSAWTTSGHISLDAVDSQIASYRCTNGSIIGSVVGARQDYAFNARTTNGSVHPETGGTGPRTIDAVTTSGSISISFE